MDADRLLVKTGFSKVRSAAIIAAVFGLYLLENFSPDFIRNTQIFIYLISPILWSLIVFMIFCFPRPRPRGKLRANSICLWMVFLCSIFYILIMMLCGVVVGFGKSPYDHSALGIVINIFKIFPALIATELVRNYLVNADHTRTRLGFYAFITICIALMNLNPSQIENLETNLSIVQFIGADLLVELSSSLFATYLVYVGGPILSIVYLGIQESFYWFSPFLPNLNWITQAFIGILLPIFSMMIFHFGYSKEMRDYKTSSKEDANPLGWIAVTAISILIIWFAIGVFPIRPYVILTGSMEPLISPGDIVLVRRIDADDNVQVGDVIEYKSGDIYIFHRIIEIVEEDEETKYRTKGDNNTAEDPELVETKNLKGRLVCVIPKIGYPALLFH